MHIDQRPHTDGTSNYRINNLTKALICEQVCITIVFRKGVSVPQDILVSNCIDMYFGCKKKGFYPCGGAVNLQNMVAKCLAS